MWANTLEGARSHGDGDAGDGRTGRTICVTARGDPDPVSDPVSDPDPDPDPDPVSDQIGRASCRERVS
jgi:hypothetical protein